ncbi:MAG: purine-nucleoside phosphorylase [Kiritimatiellae bacterium]|nr:purine-nucleoside phosphorylase [Kiritimatiellia bacterium]
MNQQLIDQAVQVANDRLGNMHVDCALLLGSGWSDAIGNMEILAELPYSELPLPGGAQVKGHVGRLLLTRGFGATFLAFQGRRHWYEGLGWEPVVFPLYLSAACGAKTITLTNAAGGVNPAYSPGDLMLIRDHVNWMGSNPLVGAYDPDKGPRFPDQSDVYNANLRSRVKAAMAEQSARLHEGVYMATSGPAYETPSEIKAFRAMGADAVGMSTVPEAMVANWMGLRCLAISCITNMASSVGDGPLSHDEVLAVTQTAIPTMQQLLESCCRTMVQSLDHTPHDRSSTP